MGERYAQLGLIDTPKAKQTHRARHERRIVRRRHESAQQERQMSRGNREKKKPKADKNKAKPVAAVTPFGTASNAGKASGKSK